MSFRTTIVVVALLIFARYQQVKPQTNNSYNGFDLVDKAGNIRKPGGYRDRYPALGTYAVVDLNGGTDMHYTYASPGAAEYYRKNAKFADGTVLVKEVFGTDHAQMTTGDAHWASGNESVVCDDQRGNRTLSWQSAVGRWMGMGAFQIRCARQAGRHGLQERLLGLPYPARTTDWVYVQGYPVLAAG